MTAWKVRAGLAAFIAAMQIVVLRVLVRSWGDVGAWWSHAIVWQRLWNALLVAWCSTVAVQNFYRMLSTLAGERRRRREAVCAEVHDL